MTHRMTVAVLTLLVAAPAAGADLPPVGRYQISVMMGSPGLLMEEIYASDECLSAVDLSEGPVAYTKRHPQEGRECQVDEYSIGDDAVHMNLVCTFGPTRAAIVGKGSFNAEGFLVDNDVKLGMQGMELEVKAVLTGTFVGDCDEPAADAESAPAEGDPAESVSGAT
jgi:hypothetical protein